MFRIEDPGVALCDGWTRREWLRIGAVGALSLPALLQARAAAAAPTGKAKACIQLFLLGAPPQMETWDPKPDAPAEVRGDLRPIATSVPGILVNELMPRTAALVQHLAILRGVVTNDNAHSSSAYYMTTGYPHTPMGAENARVGAPNDWPSLGAVVRKMWHTPTALPAAITLPEQAANDGNLTWPGQDAGFLGRAADPWLLNGDPAAASFQIQGLQLPDDVASLRLERRRRLVDQVDEHLDRLVRAERTAVYGSYTRQALGLVASSEARRAFDLGQEPSHVRDRYGRTRFGQSLLLARRLAEAGVPLIRVNWTRVAGALNNGHWDTHTRNADALKQLMPILDQAYSALLEDLLVRGMLDETLVMWMAEFGRTPRLNGAAGRDHWGQVFSVALAGGGVRGGVVHGASDRIAAYPRDGRVLPQDLTATVFHCLGIPAGSEFHDNLGRPLAVTRGTPIQAVLR